MAKILPPHGGVDEPVNRIVDTLGDTAGLPKINVVAVDQTSLYRIADGTLSPLTGPMGKADYDQVLNEKSITRSGEKWAWAIPVPLPVTDAEAETLKAGEKAALEFEGSVFGVITIDSVYDWDKSEFIEKTYGTSRTDHPGARLWTGDERTKLCGGEISLLAFNDDREFKDRIMSPADTRKLLAEEGYDASIAFQTRNPLHRAHEYALVYGAEKVLRDEKPSKIGVFLNPLVGQLKGDDVPAATRMLTYERLIDGHYLGDGDKDVELWKSSGQDLNQQTKLAGLDMRMYYGGPSEAVMHAIYRQNLGFTKFIIGRKHADAPYDDKTDIWGDFDAQEIFSKLGGKLAIETVNVGFAAYFEEIARVGLVEDNKGKTTVSISGTKVRSILNSGEMPDSRIMRPSTAEVLIEYYKKKNEAAA
uniref:Sulfate adenylyltransferase n=1 Tax=Rhodosorus marinus TaxID=101924 RepID=A0A7S3EJ92_9RHOD